MPFYTHRRHSQSRLAFIWPRDKPAMFRFRDLLTAKGPDIFIGRLHPEPPTTYAAQNAYGPAYSIQSPTHYPAKPSWTNRHHLDPFTPSTTTYPLPWAQRPTWRKYDFGSRRYLPDHDMTVTDVKYRGEKTVYAARDVCGQWKVNPKFVGWNDGRHLPVQTPIPQPPVLECGWMGGARGLPPPPRRVSSQDAAHGRRPDRALPAGSGVGWVDGRRAGDSLFGGVNEGQQVSEFAQQASRLRDTVPPGFEMTEDGWLRPIMTGFGWM